MIDNKLYAEDIRNTALLPLPWEKLEGSGILITGATGLIGSFLTDVLMYRNINFGMDCHVYAVCRNIKKAEGIFKSYQGTDWEELLSIISADINEPLDVDLPGNAGFIVHLASNTHPVAYSTDPIGTITSNIIGTKNLLDLAVKCGCKRFAFASSNEIYGENRGDTEFFDESYLGYIDCNTLRAGYPEGKRCGEALCQAYMRQKGLDVVIPRLTRTIGPTVKADDTKASSQFLGKALAGEDIVLKSDGSQYYSYTYVSDAAGGLLYVLLAGESGQAYNIADVPGDIRLRDLAGAAAGWAGTRVVFDLPDEVERAGFSKATKARLLGDKLKGLGWEMRYDIREGVTRTLDILSQAGR